MLLAERADKVSYLYYLLGVKSYRRLVENHDRRIAYQCLSNADALTVSL